MRQRGLDVQLLVVGEGKRRTELQDLARELAIDDHTELSVRFGTGSAERSGPLVPGERVSVGLHRSDIIVIPGSSPA